MRFKEGHTKVGGRKKGVPNRLKPVQKDALSNYVDSEIKKLPKLIKGLTDMERLTILTKILPFVRPKKQEISIDKEIESLLAHINKLGADELARLKEIIMECMANNVEDE